MSARAMRAIGALLILLGLVAQPAFGAVDPAARGIAIRAAITATMNGTTLTTINSRLTTDEGMISTNSGAITSLTGRVTAVEGGVATNGTAIGALQTRATTIEATATTNASTASKGVSKADMKARLLRMFARGQREYIINGLVPVAGNALSTWAASTAYGGGAKIAIGNSVSYPIKAGTSGTAAPTPSDYAVDGTQVLQEVGYLLPVDFTQRSATWVAGQRGYAGGEEFRVSVAGTSAATGSGPTPSSLMDGTVMFEHVGPQAAPLVSVLGTLPSGLSQKVGWSGVSNIAGMGATVLGGTPGQNGTNGFGKFPATSYDGSYPIGYSNGASSNGSTFTIFTPGSAGGKLCIQEFASGDSGIWSDGVLVAALAYTSASANTYVCVDYTKMQGGMTKSHTVRIDTGNSQFAGWFGTASDYFAPYVPFDAARGIFTGDSFGNTAPAFSFMGIGASIGRRLGFDDWRVNNQGGTCLLINNGTSVSYAGRRNAGVLQQQVAKPNFMIEMIEDSQNCTGNAGVGGGVITNAQLKAELNREVAEDISLGIQPFILSIWGGTGPISAAGAAAVQAYADDQAVATANGVPFIDWANILTSGGFAGATNTASGNSGSLVIGDGVHPTQKGANVRVDAVTNQMGVAISGLSTL